MLEIVLMRAFVMLYASDFEVDDDDRRQYKSGKSSNSERQAFTVLSSVCCYWYHTLIGFPESLTGLSFNHRLRKLIKRECAKLT